MIYFLYKKINNFVKNKTVNFTVTADHSVGYLSPATAKTDSAGMASVLFIGGPAPSETGGVTITAIEPISGITATTTLTVAKKPLYVTLGTGNTTAVLSSTTYQKDFTALVTDGAGNPVKDAVVTAKLTPIAYYKGYIAAGKTDWVWVYTLTSTNNPRNYPYTDSIDYCLNEDLTWYGANPSYILNGILDTGEDFNNNGVLDPRNIAAVTSTATTDANGLGTLSIVYPKNYGSWLTVRLEATALMAGTEGKAYNLFTLPLVASDYPFPTISPPNSPFGVSSSCADVVATPALLVVTAASDALVNLSWTLSTGAVGYKIYKGGVFLKQVPLSTSATTDTAVTANTLYSYTVSAFDGATPPNESAQTAAVNVTTPPAVPTWISATTAGPNQINLSWNAATGASGYRIYRDVTTKVKDAVTTSASDAGLNANTNYCYSVSAYSSTGVESAKSSQLCATTDPGTLPTPAFTITGSTAATVSLSITNSAGAVLCNVYRNGLLVASVPVAGGATKAWTDGQIAGLTSNTQYCYAIDAEGESGAKSARTAEKCYATTP
ncbi:MAG: hypothetical protein WCK00_05835 [Deltaproteobacteria bacterium]